MAEAIARHRYSDVIEASSAGVGPAPIVQPQTYQCLAEEAIPLEPDKKPQRLDKADWQSMDLIVNISGQGILPLIPDYEGGTLIWEVLDPIGLPPAAYREARVRLEQLVERLAEMLRKSRQ